MSRKNNFLVFLIFVFVISLAAGGEAQEIEEKNSPLAILTASYRGDEKSIREILAAGADKDVRDAFGATPLHLAMFQSNLAVVKLLLDYGFDPNAVASRNGFTPLHNAVAANNADAARLLIQYGADKNIKCGNGLTPLDKARKEEKRALIFLLYR